MEESHKRGVGVRLIAAIATVLIVFSVLVACVKGIAFDSSFYKQEYAGLNTAGKLDFEGASYIDEATDVLLGYLTGERESLDLAMASGDQYYNDRETVHMQDVKVLYQNALAFMVIGFTVGGALLLFCVLYHKRRHLKQTLQMYFWTTLGVLVFFAVIGIWAAVDFNNFWISFHHVFFTNDLWMLDPATSRMINMFEEQLFADLVTRILVAFLAVAVGACVAAGIAHRKLKKHGV